MKLRPTHLVMGLAVIVFALILFKPVICQITECVSIEEFKKQR